MKIKGLSLTNFTAFEQAQFNFCDGINVLIGANGTGKTHAMKAMYAVVPDSRDWNKIFNLPKLQYLIRNNSEDKDMVGGITSIQNKNDNSMEVIFQTESCDRAAEIKMNVDSYNTLSPIYLPTVEMLSIYDHFFATYERREIPYDMICYNLALALNAAILRKTHVDYHSVEPIINTLQEIITGSKTQDEDVVVKDAEHFYFHLNGNKLSLIHI